MDIQHGTSSLETGNTQSVASEDSVGQAERLRKTLIDILQGIDDF